MSRYRFISTRLGEPFDKIAELPLSRVSFTRLRNGAGEFRASLPLHPLSVDPVMEIVPGEAAESIVATRPDNTAARELNALYREATDRGTTCIYVLRDNSPMGAWIVWNRDYDTNTGMVEISGAELTSYFRRRILEPEGDDLDQKVDMSGEKMFDAAALLVGQINEIGLELDCSTGGPILPGPVQNTSDGTVWKGTDGKWVGDILAEWAEQDDGFDFRSDLVYTPERGFARRFVLRPVLGSEETVTQIVKFGVDLSSLKVQQRGDIRANDTITIGGNVGEKRPYGRAISDSFKPTLQSIRQMSDETDHDRLDAHATSNLRAVENHEVVALSVIPSDDLTLGSFSPGDPVRLYVGPDRDPWFADGYDEIVRTLGFTVTLDDDHTESIELLVDDDVEVLSA